MPRHSSGASRGHSLATISSTRSMLRGEHHVRRAEHGVGAGREHADAEIVVTLDGEHDVGALAATDPVPLHDLDRLGPVEQVEVGQQSFGVLGDAQHPLLQGPLVDGMVAALAAPVGGDLLVREHGAERRAPVDGDLVEVRQAVRVDHLPPLDRVQLGPRAAVRHRRGRRTRARRSARRSGGPCPARRRTRR